MPSWTEQNFNKCSKNAGNRQLHRIEAVAHLKLHDIPSMWILKRNDTN